jgi:hypothetical protein
LATKEGEVTAKQTEIDALVTKRNQDDASAAGAAKQVAEDAYNMAQTASMVASETYYAADEAYWTAEAALSDAKWELGNAGNQSEYTQFTKLVKEA